MLVLKSVKDVTRELKKEIIIFLKRPYLLLLIHKFDYKTKHLLNICHSHFLDSIGVVCFQLLVWYDHKIEFNMLKTCYLSLSL